MKSACKGKISKQKRKNKNNIKYFPTKEVLQYRYVFDRQLGPNNVNTN